MTQPKFLALTLACAGALLLQSSCASEVSAVVHAFTTPKLLRPDLEPQLLSAIGMPPQEGEDAYFRDLGELFYWQDHRSVGQCADAHREGHVSLDTFFGPRSGLLTREQVKTLSPFFEQIRGESDYYLRLLKKDRHRPRPYIYLLSINPCAPREITQAYPSGHAALSRLFAHILGEIFAGRKDKFLARAHEIGFHRVLAGVHHPSDIAAGEKVADILYEEIQKSLAYQDKIKEIKKSVNSAQAD